GGGGGVGGGEEGGGVGGGGGGRARGGGRGAGRAAEPDAARHGRHAVHRLPPGDVPDRAPGGDQRDRSGVAAGVVRDARGGGADDRAAGCAGGAGVWLGGERAGDLAAGGERH